MADDARQKLAKLTDVSAHIVDDTYHDKLLNDIRQVEQKFQNFYKHMSQKLRQSYDEVKSLLNRFEVPPDVKENIKNAVKVGRSITSAASLDTEALERQISFITDILRKIPNYVELAVDTNFTTIIDFQRDPILVKAYGTGQNEGEEEHYSDDFESYTDESETEEEISGDKKSGGSHYGGIEVHCQNDAVPGQRKQTPKSSPDTGEQSAQISKVRESTFRPKSSGEPNMSKNQNRTLVPAQIMSSKDILRGKSSLSFVKRDESVKPFYVLKNELVDITVPDNTTPLTADKREPRAHSTFVLKILDELVFDINSCSDLKLFKEYIVVCTIGTIYKLSRKTKTVISTRRLNGASKMCIIRPGTLIAVIQMGPGFIAIVETKGELKILYKIATTKPYTDICHIKTYIKQYDYNPDPLYWFALAYTGRNASGMFVEHVDVVKAEKQKGILKQKYNANTSEFKVFEGDSGICSIDAFLGGNVIIGFSDKVMNVDRNGEIKWTIALTKAATCVCCCKKDCLYVCVQDEGRVMLVDREGKILDLNILPDSHVSIKPHRICYHDDTVLVKEFDDTKWRTLVHERKPPS